MNEASSEHRNSTALAMSSARPTSRSGYWFLEELEAGWIIFPNVLSKGAQLAYVREAPR